MERSDFADQVPFAKAAESQALGRTSPVRAPQVYVFNPFAEGQIAHGKAFTPTRHQAWLAEDLANLPQFLCSPDDIVLLAKRPSAGFLNSVQDAGFALPEFVELSERHIDPHDPICRRALGGLRPWAWGPDSIQLLEPLFARLSGDARGARQFFNDDIARLYSKAWSAGFLRKILGRCRATDAQRLPGGGIDDACLCSEQETGEAVDTLEGALEAIAAIRARGHHRIVVKEALGFAGQNAIRLWEPELLPAQRQWLCHALEQGRQLVVEPWLERELDFSAQLEMEPGGLKLCGYTGLINDLKGQFVANWAEPDYSRRLPAKAAALFDGTANFSERLERLYDEIFRLLEPELKRAGFLGPVGLDAFLFRTPEDECRLKPVVEINPRYTMGRLTLELMTRACPGTCGVFRLVTVAQARKAGFADLPTYARSLSERLPLRLEGEPLKIREGALCLNDPAQARACLATWEVS